jgi:hypothetical protein
MLQVGLLDNITEHLDVIRTFQLMLHRKRGRLGPVHSAALTATPAGAGGPISAAGTGSYALQHLSTAVGHTDKTQALSAANTTSGVPSSCQRALDMNPGEPEPSVLTVVHVLHPNEPAKPPAAATTAVMGGSTEAAAAAGPQGQACGRPGSSGVAKDSRAPAGGNSRPGSSGVLSKWAAGRAAAAASGMDSIDSLDAGEVLEMLLPVGQGRQGQQARASRAACMRLGHPVVAVPTRDLDSQQPRGSTVLIPWVLNQRGTLQGLHTYLQPSRREVGRMWGMPTYQTTSCAACHAPCYAVQVMKDRHPCYRRQASALLQLLAGWHLSRLKVGCGTQPSRLTLSTRLSIWLASSSSSMLHDSAEVPCLPFPGSIQMCIGGYGAPLALSNCPCTPTLLPMVFFLPQECRPDQGPPWLLRQALQPDILSALESPATTEMLHGIYVHLAGSSANPQDLSMHLSDMRLGLRFAAGFRTPQELQQEQRRQRQQQQRRQGRQRSLMRTSSGTSAGSRILQPTSSSIQRQSYATSTESSRIHSTDPIPYSPSMHSSLSPGSSLGRARTGCTNSADCSARSFQLPLYKVAAFIRTAKLLPRLLDKYIAQLQLKGQEQRVTAGGRKVDGLPVMPCLQLQLQQTAAGVMPVTSQTGQRRRSVRKSVQGVRGVNSNLRQTFMHCMLPFCSRSDIRVASKHPQTEQVWPRCSHGDIHEE